METEARLISAMNSGLRERSGSVDGNSRLVSFLYQLMRDHLPAGVVEKIVIDAMYANTTVIRYTNGFLARYAADIACRLGEKASEPTTDAKGE